MQCEGNTWISASRSVHSFDSGRGLLCSGFSQRGVEAVDDSSGRSSGWIGQIEFDDKEPPEWDKGKHT